MRSPVGVYPGRAPPFELEPFVELLATGSSPSEARMLRTPEPPAIGGVTEAPLPEDVAVPAGPIVAVAVEVPAAAPASAGRAAGRPLPPDPVKAAAPCASDAASWA